jgi:hypothetical protein
VARNDTIPENAKMNEIESFLDECADDPFFRAYPEKLDVVGNMMCKLYRSGDDSPEWSTWNRIREIVTPKDRTPRERCKELFPLLFREFEQEDRSQASHLPTASQSSYAAGSLDGSPSALPPGETVNFGMRAALDIGEAKLNTVDPQESEMAASIRSLLEILWVLQGRINAIELVTTQVIEELARSHVDPPAYMQQFVGRARARPASADVDDPAKVERTIKERDIALEEFLTVILENAALFEA